MNQPGLLLRKAESGFRSGGRRRVAETWPAEGLALEAERRERPVPLG
ncbi:MAG: hypothetical protein VX610_07855 [SAR324 cluster bacterium]|nr:hypothetical protein [SAR324 cluster bacterium]